MMASREISSVKAVATIAAPADPLHVKHLLGEKIENLQDQEKVEVTIGGRPFKLGKEFLQDLNEYGSQTLYQGKGQALLILHSPQDDIVSIDHAKKLYQNAYHPKSFISLDGADHLLTGREDAFYTGSVIATWARRYLGIQPSRSRQSEKGVIIRLSGEGYTTQISARRHNLIADEPDSVGGSDLGPSPYEYLASGLGACTAMTMRMYAERKKWNLECVTVSVEHGKIHSRDFQNCEEGSQKVDRFVRLIKMEGDLNEEQKAKLVEIANKCPVHQTLSTKSIIETHKVEEKQNQDASG